MFVCSLSPPAEGRGSGCGGSAPSLVLRSAGFAGPAKPPSPGRRQAGGEGRGITSAGGRNSQARLLEPILGVPLGLFDVLMTREQHARPGGGTELLQVFVHLLGEAILSHARSRSTDSRSFSESAELFGRDLAFAQENDRRVIGHLQNRAHLVRLETERLALDVRLSPKCMWIGGISPFTEAMRASP